MTRPRTCKVRIVQCAVIGRDLLHHLCILCAVLVDERAGLVRVVREDALALDEEEAVELGALWLLQREIINACDSLSEGNSISPGKRTREVE